MKSKDIALLIAVAGFSAIASFVASTAFFSYDKGKGISVEVAAPITTEFVQKNTDDYRTNYEPIFNEQSINPTQLIQIGDGSNPRPL